MTDTACASNLPDALEPLVRDGRIPARRVWGMLAIRSVLTFSLLLAVAGGYAASGASAAFAASAAWWLWFVTFANVACLALMARFAALEGLRLRDLFFICGRTWRGDLAWAAFALVGTAVLAMLPGTVLASALWRDASRPNGMLFQALPLLAIYPLFALMPVTQAFAELPIYWGYVAPRLRAAGIGRWAVVLLVGAVLSFQHVFFAFQPDWRYDIWLALKFLPFALWTGFILDRRPTTLPYLMVMHLLLDASLPLLTLMASTGMRLG